MFCSIKIATLKKMSEFPVWLGIDPGLATIGWAFLQTPDYGNPDLIECGTILTSKGQSTAQRLVEIELDLTELVREYQPERIAMEMPFFSREIKAAGGVIMAVGVIIATVTREIGIEPVLLHQASWKSHLGNGRADKSEVAEIVSGLFELENIPKDDAVDAMGIAYAASCGLTNQIRY